jgi:hypothetical protein
MTLGGMGVDHSSTAGLALLRGSAAPRELAGHAGTRFLD